MVWRWFYGENADVFPGIIARNKSVFEYERFIHRTFYPKIIHPYSKFRVYWEVAMVLFYSLQLALYVFYWGFISHRSPLYQILLAFFQLVNAFDFVLTFFTGYVEKKTEIVVLHPGMIAKKYLLSTCVFDFFSCIPFQAVSGLCTLTKYSNLCSWIFYSTMMPVFFRTPTCVRYLKNTSFIFFWNPFLVNLISFSWYFCVIFYWSFFYLHFAHGYSEDEYIGKKAIWSDLAKFVEFFLENGFEILFLHEISLGVHCLMRIVTLVLFFFFYLLLVAYLVKYARFRMKMRERYLALEPSVRIFSKKRQLPYSLKQKILLYFVVYLENNHHREDEIFNYFPDTLRSDVFSHKCLPLLKAFYAFEDLPFFVLKRLTECLKYQLYLPNETVMTRDEGRLSLYFVSKGTVALYSVNNTELYHFQEGSSFNGKFFIEGFVSKHHYAISLEVTEIYQLYHDDFMEVMSCYPDLLKHMKEKYLAVATETHDLIQ